MNVSDRIQHGASELAAEGMELHFGTFTLGPEPGCRPETHAEQVARLMLGWRRVVQGRWWRDNVGEYFRVVESGSENGRPHVHFVAAGGRLPHVPAIRRGERLKYWRARLGNDGRGLVAVLERAGLGPVCHIERL